MNRKVRVAVVGLGAWGECHVAALEALPQAEVVAVCDARSERANEIAAHYGVPTCETEGLWARDDIDLVSVATPEAGHLKAVMAALQSGKHVLVEKPVSTNVADARAMQQAAQKSGKFLVPGHILRFDARYAQVKRFLDAGQIGKPLSLFTARARPQWQLKVHGQTHTAFVLMAHDIDIALWWMQSRVRRVRALERFVEQEKRVTTGRAPDVLWATLEFENGVVAILHSSWLLPAAAGIERADNAEIIGEGGVLRLQTSDCGLELWSDDGENRGRFAPDLNLHYSLAGQWSGALREQFGYLCNCILRDETPAHVSFEDAIHGVEIERAIIESAQNGRDVTIGEI